MQNNTVNTLVDSGTYTPTVTMVLNLDSVTAHGCQYLRVGNVVTVSGEVGFDCTSIGSLTQFRVSLPIASNFSNAYECAGGGAEKFTAAQSACTIQADTTNDAASIIFRASSSASSIFFSFTYQII